MAAARRLAAHVDCGEAKVKERSTISVFAAVAISIEKTVAKARPIIAAGESRQEATR
jgi:hypothetical protein